MKKYSLVNPQIISFLLIILSQFAFAEGTPSASPNSSNITALLIAPDLASGSYLNCSTDNRIYFNINDSTNENLYFGFDFRQYAAGAPTRLTNVYYKIMNPDGTIASSGLWNSTIGSIGSIDAYSNAIVGPNIGSTTTGYLPLVFNPTISGEHWIEFYRSNDGGITPLVSSADRIQAPFFDLTIAENSGTFTRKNGRLHSNKWSLLAVTTTYGILASASSNPILYAYTDDQSVIRVDFQNGFQPIAYSVAINNYGTTQTGTYDESRKSRNDAVAPTLSNGYKVFLNIPDSNIYPVAAIPASPTFQAQAITGNSPFNINYTTQEQGDVSILIDLNGTAGYQAETTDVILEAYNVPAGNNSIVWNGLNGLGVPVTSSLNITLSLKLLKGRFNLPLHDVEVNKNGFNVSIVAPVPVPNMQLFWDDSQLTTIGSTCDGTSSANNITVAGLNMSKQGVQSPGHAWNGDGNINQLVPAPSVSGNDTDLFQCNDFGNVRTINTWGWGIFSTQTNISLNIYTLAVTTPTPYQICDNNNDGLATFDLTSKNSEILGTLNNSDYTVSYYVSQVDSQNNTNPILNPTAFISSSIIAYVRVWENANPNNFAITSLNLVVNASPIVNIDDVTFCSNSPITLICGFLSPSNIYSWWLNGVLIPGANTNTFIPTTSGTYTASITNPITGCSATDTAQVVIIPAPTANQVPNLTQVDIPYDGQAVFDLTSQIPFIIGSQTNCSVSFYNSIADAQSGINGLPNPAAYMNLTNPQTIGVRVVDNINGCYTITNFELIVTNPDIVYIPDVNFKSKLIALGVDTNSDGEIQYSEALVPTSLDVSGTYNLNGGITNMTGIEAFTNLTNLYCNFNLISNLDIAQNINLQFLESKKNQLTSLNVSNNINLEQLIIDNNNINSIDLLNNVNLTILHLYENQLTNLDVTQNVNLENLIIYHNQITNLDLTNNINLIELDFSQNFITDIDVTQNVNLQSLSASYNQISDIDVTQNVNLLNLYIAENQFSSINITQNINLSVLYCELNQITSLNLTQNNSLVYLDCSSNQLTSLDLINNSNLTSLYCNNNQLTSLFIKNGSIENNINFNYNPDLLFICADDDQLLDIQNQLISNGMTNTVVNSYCSFNPGGDYNTITGTVKYDFDNNGCDNNDVVFPNVKMKMTQWGINSATFTNQLGNYTFYTTFADQLVEPQIENPSYFNFSPQDASISFPDNNNNIFTQNFCLSPNGTHNDLEVSIMPITPARPGFEATYKLVLRNKGNQTLNSWTGLLLNYDVAKMSFVSSSITADSSIAGQLGFGYFINPFETLFIEITFAINTPTATNAVNIGDILNFNSSIVIANDELPLDNIFNYAQTVVGSFDPNSIECLEGESVSPTEIGKYLHYAVNFENTGTYEAENVVVKDVIDTNKYDIESLQVMNTSHPAYIKITGNVVEFIFKNIHLAPRGGNPPVGGHGNVLFKIKSKNNLVADDFVEKTAKIYFDYNAPIDTNIAQTTFVSLSNSIPVIDNSVIVFPNPTTGNVNISSNFNIKSIELYDIQGRILETSFENSNTTKLDISEKQKGVYFLKINTENGSKIEKVVRE